MRRALASVVLAVLTLALLPAAAPADGQLDPSFGNGGRVVLSHHGGPVGEGTSNLFPLGGGRFQAAGLGDGNGLWVTQHLADGSLDPGWAEAGQTFFTLNGKGGFTSVSNAARQADGSIVAVGGYDPGGPDFDSMILRLTPGGEIDPSFGNDAPHPAGDGVDLYDFGGDDYAAALTIDSTGKVVIAGRVGPGNEYDLHLARLNVDGSIDSTFGGPTGVTTDLGPSEEAVAIAPQGERLIVVSAGVGGSHVLRYLPNGQLDPSFGGGDGVAEAALPAGQGERGLLVEPNGDVVVSGASGESVQIARMLPDGSPDPGWGNEGVAVFRSAAGTRFAANALARMDDGRILAGGAIRYRGKAPDENREPAAIIRTLPNGKPDPAWGSDGILQLPVGPEVFEGIGVLQVEPDRRILAGGGTFSDADEDSNRLVMRILGDTTPPDTAITQAPPATATAPLAPAGFSFAPVGDANTSFECALSETAAAPTPVHKKKRKKRHHHKRHHHGKKRKPGAHGSAATTTTALGAFAPCTSPVSYPSFAAPGDYRFAVRAIDPAGNVDPTPAEASVHVVAKQQAKKKPKKHHRKKHHRKHRGGKR